MTGRDQVGIGVERDLDRFIERRRQGRQRRGWRKIRWRKAGEELIVGNVCFERRLRAGQSGPGTFKAGLGKRDIGPGHHTNLKPVRGCADLFARHFHIVFPDGDGFEVAADIDISRDDLKDQVLDGRVILRLGRIDPGPRLPDARADAPTRVDRHRRLELRAGNRAIAIRAGEVGERGIGIDVFVAGAARQIECGAALGPGLLHIFERDIRLEPLGLQPRIGCQCCINRIREGFSVGCGHPAEAESEKADSEWSVEFHAALLEAPDRLSALYA